MAARGKAGTRRIGAASALALLALGFAAPARAEVDGRTVMERFEARRRGADEMLRAVWRLVDPRGGERVRETRAFWQDCRGRCDGLHSRRLIVFDAPPPVKGTAFLVYAHLDPGAEDLRWIYLPALRKVRRIAGSDRHQLFAGTDFAYEDLADRAVDEDDHRLLRSEERDGALHHVVESIPRGPSGYSKRISWVREGSWIVPRVEYFDRAGRHAKTLEARWGEADGIAYWQRLEMQNHLRKQHTIVEASEFRHDLGLGDDAFSENALALGVP